MIAAIRRGSVFLVNDIVLTLPPNDGRQYHQQRYVVVMSGNLRNSDPNWPTVLVVPTSTQGKLATAYCVKLDKGVGNLPQVLLGAGHDAPTHPEKGFTGPRR